MSKTDKTRRDAFTLSLGGIRTVAPFTFAPALPNDRINKLRDQRQHKAARGQGPESQAHPDHGQTAQRNCA